MLKRLILFLVIAILFLLVACGDKQSKPATPSALELLKAKYDTYLVFLAGQSDADGFIYTNGCDSLIFSALANTPTINITAAEVEPGRWHRRPATYPECFASGGSKSDISRDGLLGVIFYAIKHKDVPMLKRLWDFGNDHNWFMGMEGKEHSIYGPEHIAILARALYVLSNGTYNYSIKSIILPDLYAQEGYRAHLQQINMLVVELLNGPLDFQSEQIRETLAEKNPNNALHQYLNKNEAKAVDILLNKFPNDRLPTSSDWCSEWIWQREEGDSDLQPCPDVGRTHSGGDFVFLARMILEGK